jgi:hypothetical protein
LALSSLVDLVSVSLGPCDPRAPTHLPSCARSLECGPAWQPLTSPRRGKTLTYGVHSSGSFLRRCVSHWAVGPSRWIYPLRSVAIVPQSLQPKTTTGSSLLPGGARCPAWSLQPPLPSISRAPWRVGAPTTESCAADLAGGSSPQIVAASFAVHCT